jgi:hypothetical protein
MTNAQICALIRKARHVYMDALAAHDTVEVRVYKNDVLELLRQNLTGTAFEANLHPDGTLYIHPAE